VATIHADGAEEKVPLSAQLAPTRAASPSGPWDSSPAVVFGPGSIEALPIEIERRVPSGARILLVVGSSSGGRAWRARLLRRLTERYRPELHQHRGRHATPASVAAVAEHADALRPGAVVALGGGTVLDAGKAAVASIGAVRAPPPLFTVPTTAGTGAEVTPFATVWDLEREEKTSMETPRGEADVAVVDPDLIATLPHAEVASGLLDALVQGAEAAWSVESTPVSTACGLSALALVGLVWTNSDAIASTPALRTALCLAGLQSGRAISAARTGMCHALSYPLTLRYGLRHGHACALSFGPLLVFNESLEDGDCRDPRGAAHVRAVVRRIVDVLGAATAEEVAAETARILRESGLCSLAEGNVDIALVVHDALAYARVTRNPRTVEAHRLVELLGAGRDS
jgi:alcohol dehydrogenase class IV